MGLPCQRSSAACKPPPFDILIVEDAGGSVMIVGSVRQARKRLVGREPPGLLIADLNLPDSRGLVTLRALRGMAPAVAIVVFSASDDKSTEQAVLDLGAKAFISKSALPQSFVQKIAPFLQGVKSLGDARRSAPAAAHATEIPHAVDLLTERQRAVLAEAANGYRNREIALRLKIGEQTVSTHLNAIFQRLGVQNRTQASMQYMAWAKAHGVLD
jgi:DNA-binding NarL/FixJ family response regulator